MTKKKVMDHWHYQKKTETMSEEQLQFIIQDAKKTMATNPEGPNNDYYADEINYCSMELYRRARRKTERLDKLEMKNKKLVKVETV